MRIAILASVIVAVLSLTGLYTVPLMVDSLADMYLEPKAGIVKTGDTFVVKIMVSARTPVNVFKGEVAFDETVITVESIDYNTSIADLWAERPWYENGNGTINFIGGTTKGGGFLGTDELMTITFRSHTQGDAFLRLKDTRILAHDGLGTDVPLGEPIDGLFTVSESVLDSETVTTPEMTTSIFVITPTPPTTDLNGDGEQSIADISIFMRNMLSNDSRFDFNGDTKIDGSDLSIIMGAK